ncbi:MAG: DUF362 domain-containing protein [Thermodesulfobacteriota bacterium]
MKRRKFLKGMAGLSAGMIFSHSNAFGSTNRNPSIKPPVSKKETGVFLAGVPKGASEEIIKSAVREAALAASDFSWLSRGDSVFIKPALNSGQPYPSTTSPLAVASVIKLLKEKGARRVIVGDMSGIEHVTLSPDSLSGSTRKLMESSGMAGSVQAAGGEIHFFEEGGWKAFYEDPMVAGTHWKRGLMMPNILKEVDHIVLMPRCSRHVLAGATLGLKAAVGYWRTDTRLEYHRDAASLHEKTAEANTAKTLLNKQRLVISAADKILTTFGPDKGFVYQPEIGLMIASESVVAHDMVSLAWLLENRNHIPSGEQGRLNDTSAFVAWLANYWLVYKLGGWKPVFSADKLEKNDLKSIWDDRVLNRAYQVFDNTIPKVTIHEVNHQLSDQMRKRLTGMLKVK